MPCDDWYDDEPPPPPPLSVWKKRALRDEVVRLRELEKQLRRDIGVQADKLLAMRTYAQANYHHERLLAKVRELFDVQGWRIVDMRMTTENTPTVEIPTLDSLYSSTLGGSPRGVLMLEMAPCPPKPEEIS